MHVWAWVPSACAGRLATSKVGAGNAGAAVGGENAYDSRRTSSSMLLDPKILVRFGVITEDLRDLDVTGGAAAS